MLQRRVLLPVAFAVLAVAVLLVVTRADGPSPSSPSPVRAPPSPAGPPSPPVAPAKGAPANGAPRPKDAPPATDTPPAMTDAPSAMTDSPPAMDTPPAMTDAPTPPKDAGPVGRAAFDRLEHDFGTAKQEQTLHTEFRVTNEGQLPLEVTDLRADCGCAAATIESRHLEPGASVAIKVTFRTLAASGKLVKRIRVSTNDPAHALVELLLKVDVSAGIVVDPSTFAFGDVAVGTAPSKTLRVEWKEGVGRSFQLTAVEALVADVRLETKPFDDPPWHGFEVTATFVKPPRVGVVSGMALLRTDDPDYPRITAAIQAFVSGKIWVDRRTVSLGWIPAGKGRATAIVCRAFTPDVDLGEIKAKSRKGRVEAVPTRSGKDWIVMIKVPEDAAAGRIDDVIELTCSLPGEPAAEVTVTAFVNAAGGK